MPSVQILTNFFELVLVYQIHKEQYISELYRQMSKMTTSSKNSTIVKERSRTSKPIFYLRETDTPTDILPPPLPQQKKKPRTYTLPRAARWESKTNPCSYRWWSTENISSFPFSFCLRTAWGEGERGLFRFDKLTISWRIRNDCLSPERLSAF